MLQHINASPLAPERVVIVGAGGFVGQAIAGKFTDQGVPVVLLTRNEVDLTGDGAGEKLAGFIKPNDHLVLVAAKAPVKNIDMLEENIKIIKSLAHAVQQSMPAHVLNISSDALFCDSIDPLFEDSPRAPSSFHGIMHLTREVALEESMPDGAPFATLRPTLIYGNGDPHNGYGPNRFARLAKEGQAITFFGKGEERRDHVWVGDVAELALRICFMKSKGALNAATGRVISFYDIGEIVRSSSENEIDLITTPRNGPMPHNGYRAFDPSATKTAFPDFEYVMPEVGIAALAKGADPK